MPLHWIIDSRTELVSAVAEGDVSFADAMTFLRTLSGAKVTGYRKLFDGRAGTSSMSEQELLMISWKSAPITASARSARSPSFPTPSRPNRSPACWGRWRLPTGRCGCSTTRCGHATGSTRRLEVRARNTNA